MGVIGPEHPTGKSAEAEWVVVSPGNRKTESLGELLQLDQRRSRVNPDRLSTKEQFSRVAGRAGNAEHYILLSSVGIFETIVACESHRQAVRVFLGGGVWNETETLHVRVFP